MFTANEVDFIKSLASDYAAAYNLHQQETSNAIASPNTSKVASSTGRRIGTTDYARFENLAAELDYQESQERKETKPIDPPSRFDNHGPNCAYGGSSCSHDHSKERSIFEKSFEDKISATRLFREEGNELFRGHNYGEAASSYKRAVVYLDYTIGDTPEEISEAEEERCKCYLNLAACYLEMRDFDSAINYCRLAIQIDSENSKGFYRRGIAHLRKGDLEDAQNDLYKAMKLTAAEPIENRRAVEIAIRELNVKWRDYRKKSAQLAKSAIRL
jgi:tetratricopeptide (TPR) repeat protein